MHLKMGFRYLSPEYFMHGIVDEKTDVFAYGVLLLEIITGRRAIDSSRQSLVIWVWHACSQNLSHINPSFNKKSQSQFTSIYQLITFKITKYKDELAKIEDWIANFNATIYQLHNTSLFHLMNHSFPRRLGKKLVSLYYESSSNLAPLYVQAKPLLDTNNVKELADPRLGDNYDIIEMKRVMSTASICIHHSSTLRPNMNRVWDFLALISTF